MALESSQVIYCTACGAQNIENNFRCVKCGQALHEPVPATSGYKDPLLEFVPYRNVASLWAYYLGVFALIPCFGIALGIAAIVMGIIGIRYSQKHPEAKGMVHSLVGIVLGGLVLLGHLAVLLIFLANSK
jgi:hypothetical protein